MSGELRDVNDPEVRMMLLNEVLATVQAAEEVKAAHDLIESTTFKDLTPEKWAEIHACLPGMKKTSEHTIDAMKRTGFIMDSPTMMADLVHMVQAEKNGEL